VSLLPSSLLLLRYNTLISLRITPLLKVLRNALRIPVIEEEFFARLDIGFRVQADSMDSVAQDSFSKAIVVFEGVVDESCFVASAGAIDFLSCEQLVFITIVGE